jgi:PAS domain S-box-containing protein
VVLALVRVLIEGRSTRRAESGVRLLIATLEQVHELIVLVRDGHIVWANQAFTRAVGYSLPELERLPIDRLVTDVSLGQWPAVQAALLRGQSVTISGEVERRDGSRFPATCDVLPLVEESGPSGYFIGVVRDRTDELRVREQLVRGERLSAIGSLLSGLTQELNSPLQSVIAHVELGLAGKPGGEVRAHLERARADASRAGRIVRNLLTFEQKEPGERMLA